jgi:hypothetical protein
MPLGSNVLTEVLRDERGYRVRVPPFAAPADYRLAKTIVDQLATLTQGTVVLPSGTTVPLVEFRRWLDPTRVEGWVQQSLDSLAACDGELLIEGAVCTYAYGPGLAARLEPKRPGFRERWLHDFRRHQWVDPTLLVGGIEDAYKELDWRAREDVPTLVLPRHRQLVPQASRIELLLLRHRDPHDNASVPYDIVSLAWSPFVAGLEGAYVLRDERSIVIEPLTGRRWERLVAAAEGSVQ